MNPWVLCLLTINLVSAINSRSRSGNPYEDSRRILPRGSSSRSGNRKQTSQRFPGNSPSNDRSTSSRQVSRGIEAAKEQLMRARLSQDSGATQSSSLTETPGVSRIRVKRPVNPPPPTENHPADSHLSVIQNPNVQDQAWIDSVRSRITDAKGKVHELQKDNEDKLAESQARMKRLEAIRDDISATKAQREAKVSHQENTWGKFANPARPAEPSDRRDW